MTQTNKTQDSYTDVKFERDLHFLNDIKIMIEQNVKFTKKFAQNIPL